MLVLPQQRRQIEEPCSSFRANKGAYRGAYSSHSSKRKEGKIYEQLQLKANERTNGANRAHANKQIEKVRKRDKEGERRRKEQARN